MGESVPSSFQFLRHSLIVCLLSLFAVLFLHLISCSCLSFLVFSLSFSFHRFFPGLLRVFMKRLSASSFHPRPRLPLILPPLPIIFLLPSSSPSSRSTGDLYRLGDVDSHLICSLDCDTLFGFSAASDFNNDIGSASRGGGGGGTGGGVGAGAGGGEEQEEGEEAEADGGREEVEESTTYRTETVGK